MEESVTSTSKVVPRNVDPFPSVGHQTMSTLYGYTNFGHCFDDNDEDDDQSLQYQITEHDDELYDVDNEEGEFDDEPGYSDFSVEELHEFMLQQQQQSLLEYACSARRYSLLETIEEETIDEVLTTSTSSDGGESVRSSDYSGAWCWGDDFTDGAESVIFIENPDVDVEQEDRDVDEFELEDQVEGLALCNVAGSDGVSSSSSSLEDNGKIIIQDPSDYEGSWLDFGSHDNVHNRSKQRRLDLMTNTLSKHFNSDAKNPRTQFNDVNETIDSTSLITIESKLTPEVIEIHNEKQTMKMKSTVYCPKEQTSDDGHHVDHGGDLLIVFDADLHDDNDQDTVDRSITSEYGSWSDAIDAYLMSLATQGITKTSRELPCQSSMEKAINNDRMEEKSNNIIEDKKSRARMSILHVDLHQTGIGHDGSTEVVLESPTSSEDVLVEDFDNVNIEGQTHLVTKQIEKSSSVISGSNKLNHDKRLLGTKSSPDLYDVSMSKKVNMDNDMFNVHHPFVTLATNDDDYASRSQSEPCVNTIGDENSDFNGQLYELTSPLSKKSGFNFVFGGDLLMDNKRKSLDDLTTSGHLTSSRRRSMYSFSSKSFTSSEDDDHESISSSDDMDDCDNDMDMNNDTMRRGKSLFPRFTPPGTLRSFRSFDSLNLAGKEEWNFEDEIIDISKNSVLTINYLQPNLTEIEEENLEPEVETIRPSSEDLSEDSGCCDMRGNQCNGSNNALCLSQTEMDENGHRKCNSIPDTCPEIEIEQLHGWKIISKLDQVIDDDDIVKSRSAEQAKREREREQSMNQNGLLETHVFNVNSNDNKSFDRNDGLDVEITQVVEVTSGGIIQKVDPITESNGVQFCENMFLLVGEKKIQSNLKQVGTCSSDIDRSTCQPIGSLEDKSLVTLGSVTDTELLSSNSNYKPIVTCNLRVESTTNSVPDSRCLENINSVLQVEAVLEAEAEVAAEEEEVMLELEETLTLTSARASKLEFFNEIETDIRGNGHFSTTIQLGNESLINKVDLIGDLKLEISNTVINGDEILPDYKQQQQQLRLQNQEIIIINSDTSSWPSIVEFTRNDYSSNQNVELNKCKSSINSERDSKYEIFKSKGFNSSFNLDEIKLKSTPHPNRSESSLEAPVSLLEEHRTFGTFSPTDTDTNTNTDTEQTSNFKIYGMETKNNNFNKHLNKPEMIESNDENQYRFPISSIGGKPPLPPRQVSTCRSKIINARQKFFTRPVCNQVTVNETKSLNASDKNVTVNKTLDEFRQRALDGIERAAKSVHDLVGIENAFRTNLSDQRSKSEYSECCDSDDEGATTHLIDPIVVVLQHSSNIENGGYLKRNENENSGHELHNGKPKTKPKPKPKSTSTLSTDNVGPRKTERSSSIGYLETDIDTLHSREVIHINVAVDGVSIKHRSPSQNTSTYYKNLKSRSMFNLTDEFAEKVKIKDQISIQIPIVNQSDVLCPSSPNRAKSMEFLLKDENKATVLPPENQLQQSSNERHQLSEHELRFRRSLQKLNLPDWYKNSPLGKQGSTDLLLLRREREQEQQRRENSQGSVGPTRWEDLRSTSTSVTSLGNTSTGHGHQSINNKSVVINKRVTTPDWRYVKSSRESLLQSPMSPSLSPSPNTDKSSYFQYYYNSTGISRWSSSRLSSTTAGSSRSTSPTGSAATAPPSIRSPFQRQPYLGWRSSERLSREKRMTTPTTSDTDTEQDNDITGSFYRSAAERLSQGPGYYAMRFGGGNYRSQRGNKSDLLATGSSDSMSTTASSTTNATITGSRPIEIQVNVYEPDVDKYKDVEGSPPEHVKVATDISREIDKMINKDCDGDDDDDVLQDWNRIHVNTSPKSKRIWMESSFVGVRPIPRQPDDADVHQVTKATSPWQPNVIHDHQTKQSPINKETDAVVTDRRLSLASTTLEEVLDSLLALPSSSQSPSPSGYQTAATPTNRQCWESSVKNRPTSFTETADQQVIETVTIIDDDDEHFLRHHQPSAPPYCPEDDEFQASMTAIEQSQCANNNNNNNNNNNARSSMSSNGSCSLITSNSSTESSNSSNSSTGSKSIGNNVQAQRPTSEERSSCDSSDLTTATTVGSSVSSLSADIGTGASCSGIDTTTSGSSTTSGSLLDAKGQVVIAPPPDFTDQRSASLMTEVVKIEQQISNLGDEEFEDFPPPPTQQDIFPETDQIDHQQIKSKAVFSDELDIELEGITDEPEVDEELDENRIQERRFSRPDHQLDETVIVRCSYHRCCSSAEFRDARRSYKTCHNCYTYYCSRECRKSHWDKHRHVCMYGRIRSMCKQAIICARDNIDFLIHLSRLARTGHLTQGPGFVKIVFRNTDLALHFLRHGWSQLEDGPIYVSWKDLLPQEMGTEVYRAIIDMCQHYEPDTKFVLLASIFITREVPSMESVPHWERQVIAKCAKLSLAKSVILAGSSSQDDPNTLILTGPPRNPRGVVDLNSRRQAREVCLTNIDDRLRERGVSIRHQFPEVYGRICSYMEEAGPDDAFTPLTIYPKDGHTGQTFTCVIMPNHSSPPAPDRGKITKKIK